MNIHNLYCRTRKRVEQENEKNMDIWKKLWINYLNKVIFELLVVFIILYSEHDISNAFCHIYYN